MKDRNSQTVEFLKTALRDGETPQRMDTPRHLQESTGLPKIKCCLLFMVSKGARQERRRDWR